MLRGEDDLAQNRLVFDDPDVAFDIERLRQPVVERHQIAQPVAGFELVAVHQLVSHRHAVYLFAAFVNVSHSGENAAMFFQAEVVRLQRARGLDIVRIVHQDRSEDEALRVQVRGQTFFEHNSRR